jgi:hypothetical protein
MHVDPVEPYGGDCRSVSERCSPDPPPETKERHQAQVSLRVASQSMDVLTKTQRNHHRFLARFNREVNRETDRERESSTERDREGGG